MQATEDNPKQGTKRLFANLLVLSLSLAVALLAVGVYYLAKAKAYYDQNPPKFQGDAYFEPDAELGFVQKPNAVAWCIRPPVYAIYTDSRGVRVGRLGQESPERADVVAVGCSYTWGDGVSASDTYASVLARKTGLAVVNLAVPSYGTVGSLLTMKRAARYQPQVVVYGFMEDHTHRNVEPCASSASPYCRPLPYVDFDASNTPSIHPPRPQPPEWWASRYFRHVLMPHPFNWRDVFWAVQRDLARFSPHRKLREDELARYVSPEREAKALSFLFSRMVEEARAMRVKLVIAYIPLIYNVHPPKSDFLTALEPHLGSPGISFVDLTGPLADYVRAHGPDSLKAGGFDTHPNEEAHELMASELAPAVEKALRAS